MSNSIRIALLGNSTTDYLAGLLQEECVKHSIKADIYNSPYCQYVQEILNPGSGLYASNPDLTLLLLEGRLLFPDWYSFDFQQKCKDKEAAIQEVYHNLTALMEKIHGTCSTKILFNSFRVPYHSPLGILDHRYRPGLKRMITRLNLLLEEYAAGTDYIFVFDLDGFCAYFGNSKVEDKKMYYLAKTVMSLPFMKSIVREYMRYILPLQSMSRKCLVLDLDNTLWGGVAGEDGLSGVKLDISGTGKSFYDFQQEILNLFQKGILLAVNSKNNEEDALEIIEKHPHMVLRKKHFASMRINWRDKAENLKEIAADLNIGLDSLVFFDDNPVERELVKAALPQVEVVDVPRDTSKYVEALQSIVDFERLNLTEEDTRRNKLYEENRKRAEAQLSFKSKEEYLASLNSKVLLTPADGFSLSRIAQLTQKTNQFNMTTKRYQDSDIQSMMASGRYRIWACSVSDKFGDMGIVGVCIAAVDGTLASIDTFLMSCRALGRNLEYAFLEGVVKLLRKDGIKNISSRYIKTDKNRANAAFYEEAGFTKVGFSDNGAEYILKENEKEKDVTFIDIVLNEGATGNGQ